MAELQNETAHSAAQASEASELDRLLNNNYTPVAVENVKTGIDTLVEFVTEKALKDVVITSDDAIKTIQNIIAKLDEKISQQVNLVLHHPEFQQLESAWRGLHYLINNTETDEMLKIRVLNISKKDLSKTLDKYSGTTWDQSPLFKKLYEEEFGMLGGEPYGCLVGDYYFDHSAPDVNLLSEMAKISAAAHAPFISSVSPNLFGFKNWTELNDKADITKIFQMPEYIPWRSLRDSPDSRYLGLTFPRTLSRLPYDPINNPVDGFVFQEDTASPDGSKYSWSNAAYSYAVNINRSFKQYGWCTAIRGVENGGVVENLPIHTFPSDDGGQDVKCPTEIAISDRREAELSKNGFIAALHRKNTDKAVFIGGQSLHKPIEYQDPDATANANISARLPYLFASCRFAHYLKCIVRDKIGSFAERDDMQRFLSQWIMQYVVANPSQAGPQIRAQKPLSAAEVQVVEDESNPGFYRARFALRPHYQLEGMTVTLSLVSKLPSAKTS